LMLIKMPPYLSSNDVANGGLSDSVLFSKGDFRDAASGERLSNSQYIGVTKLRSPVLGSKLWCTSVATFFKHIARVIGGCAEEEVVGTDAGRIVTLVKHEQAIRNRAEGLLVDISRCDETLIVNRQFAIAFRVSRSHPEPAGVGFLNLRPETLSRLFGVISNAAARFVGRVATATRAILNGMPLRRPKRHKETLPAFRTLPWYCFISHAVYSLKVNGVVRLVQVVQHLCGPFVILPQFCAYVPANEVNL
jgi:hypothetical protein